MTCRKPSRTGKSWLNTVVGRPTNVQSPKQLAYFFYDELGHYPVINHKTKKATCNAEALIKLARRDPLISPICEIINEMRSLLSSSAVCMQPTESDGRMRTDYIVGGTETLRFASKQNAFGYGGNLQNITSGDEAHDNYQPKFPLPNLRRLLIPDPGYTIGEFDLEQADARIVAAEAQDEPLLVSLQIPPATCIMKIAKPSTGDVAARVTLTASLQKREFTSLIMVELPRSWPRHSESLSEKPSIFRLAGFLSIPQSGSGTDVFSLNCKVVDTFRMSMGTDDFTLTVSTGYSRKLSRGYLNPPWQLLSTWVSEPLVETAG